MVIVSVGSITSQQSKEDGITLGAQLLITIVAIFGPFVNSLIDLVMFNESKSAAHSLLYLIQVLWCYIGQAAAKSSSDHLYMCSERKILPCVIRHWPTERWTSSFFIM